MRRRVALVALGLLAAGCVHYPTVMDTGGVRIRTENGRAVRQGTDLVVTADIVSTGKYGDVIADVQTPVARQAQLVDGGGAVIPRLDVPGATTVHFTADGAHIVLRDLQRPVERGETFVVTLMFQKSGGIGIVTLLE
ncbi:MAG TPA: copper chaperone PCu(A)C [Methylomirabilota bacterium]|nr:copper chaperone PCu(A)C [Methylomirabilota bacterium]